MVRLQYIALGLFVTNSVIPFVPNITSRRLSIVLILLSWLLVGVTSNFRALRIRNPVTVLCVSFGYILISVSILNLQEVTRQNVLFFFSLTVTLLILSMNHVSATRRDFWFAVDLVFFVNMTFVVFYFAESFLTMNGFRQLAQDGGFGLNYYFNTFAIFPILFFYRIVANRFSVVNLGKFSIALIVVLLSLSRQNIAAVFVGCTFLMATMPHIWNRRMFGKVVILTMAAFLVSLLGSFDILFARLYQRFSRSFLGTGGDSERLNQVLESLNIFSENLFFGVGLGGFSEAARDLSHSVPESTYNQILSETGLLGLAYFCVMNFLFLFYVFRINSAYVRPLFIAIYSAWFFQAFFNEIFFDPYFFVLFAAAVIYASGERCRRSQFVFGQKE